MGYGGFKQCLQLAQKSRNYKYFPLVEEHIFSSFIVECLPKLPEIFCALRELYDPTWSKDFSGKPNKEWMQKLCLYEPKTVAWTQEWQ